MLSKEGATVASQSGILSAQGRPDIAASLEQGQDAIKNKTVLVPSGSIKAEALVSSRINEAFAYSPAAQGQIRDAAMARAAYLATQKGETDLTDYLGDAYKDVAGETIEYGGKVIALPLGLSDDGTFESNLESVKPEDAAKMGWPAGLVEAISSGEASLTSIGEGQYAVTIGATMVPGFKLDWNAISTPAAVNSFSFTSPFRSKTALPVGDLGFGSGMIDPSGR